ncbi:DUF441 domain-containing protein [Effusibacillus lacus]|uniref:UPF0756 membrane protein EFBL_2244 n=1 Tax=Effusibacillus lacus TaxID=1348429 RepID=A0A292YNX4_9BACL|nr:DUF441 domain-containing protein [Effusibacillus lacus]TCS73208.1 uncharacterized membrane protein (DUF441 family) [Effusibacillus lacus]GAX90609.1 DUF441 family protein [Effusibacillus lacus]
MAGEIVLVILIIVGIIGRANILATAASVLLILKLTNLHRFFPTLERRGLEIGLLFLMIAVLVPLVNGKIQSKDLWGTFFTMSGIFAVIGGILATYLNGQGLTMLRIEPQLMLGLVIGSIVGIVCFKGIPVGPLMAAAIAALLMKVYLWFR